MNEEPDDVAGNFMESNWLAEISVVNDLDKYRHIKFTDNHIQQLLRNNGTSNASRDIQISHMVRIIITCIMVEIDRLHIGYLNGLIVTYSVPDFQRLFNRRSTIEPINKIFIHPRTDGIIILAKYSIIAYKKDSNKHEFKKTLNGKALEVYESMKYTIIIDENANVYEVVLITNCVLDVQLRTKFAKNLTYVKALSRKARDQPTLVLIQNKSDLGLICVNTKFKVEKLFTFEGGCSSIERTFITVYNNIVYMAIMSSKENESNFKIIELPDLHLVKKSAGDKMTELKGISAIDGYIIITRSNVTEIYDANNHSLLMMAFFSHTIVYNYIYDNKLFTSFSDGKVNITMLPNKGLNFDYTANAFLRFDKIWLRSCVNPKELETNYRPGRRGRKEIERMGRKMITYLANAYKCNYIIRKIMENGQSVYSLNIPKLHIKISLKDSSMRKAQNQVAKLLHHAYYKKLRPLEKFGSGLL